MKIVAVLILVAASFLYSTILAHAKDCPGIGNIEDYPNLPIIRARV